ncbi:MAG: CDP-alcohol phosphatidyltransferase family protein, partial [Janthinobacterium lividum]
MGTVAVHPVPEASRGLRAAGWVLHLYTASGSVLALVAVVAAVQGDVLEALWILLAALVVDGTDGMVARRLRVSETIPGFDGARLDDIVDYLTYVFAPVVLLLCSGRLPHGPWGAVLAALPLLASCIQFCRRDAKTEDHYFLGFPSYWNVVAFYAVVLDLTPAAVAAVLVTCSVLVFVPVKYIYPSRTRTFRLLNLGLAGFWLVLYAVVLAGMPHPSRLALGLSLAYLAYYLLASVLLTSLHRLRRVGV